MLLLFQISVLIAFGTIGFILGMLVVDLLFGRRDDI